MNRPDSGVRLRYRNTNIASPRAPARRPNFASRVQSKAYLQGERRERATLLFVRAAALTGGAGATQAAAGGRQVRRLPAGAAHRAWAG